MPRTKPKTKQRGSNSGLKPRSTVTLTNNGKQKQGSNCVLKPTTKVTPASNGQKRPRVGMKPIASLASICDELQALQKLRRTYMKSRIMMSNRALAVLAGTLGYRSGLGEKDRVKLMKEAKELYDTIVKEELARDEGDSTQSPMGALVMYHWQAIRGLRAGQDVQEAQMLPLAKQLSVASWVREPEQNGFGLISLGVLVGEIGDLFNYPNPAKVWRRMGCAPYQFEGKTAMGSTWRYGKEGKLPKDEWEEFGYCPRRRSIAYVVGVGLLKLNGDGLYRTRYDEAKAHFAKVHPDYKPMRCHLHGMLLATKLLLKNLWIEWHGHPEGGWK